MTVLMHNIKEEITLKMKDWGTAETGISCILQMDVDAAADKTAEEQKNSSLKFMMVTDIVDHYMKQPVWLELFGPYTKCHKANHGFFQILKVSYTSGVTASFVMVKGNDNTNVYKFCDVEDVEKSVKILVSKA